VILSSIHLFTKCKLVIGQLVKILPVNLPLSKVKPFVPSSNVTVFKPLQFSKARTPIVVTVFPILKDDSVAIPLYDTPE
jgi:hypothetical protein